MFIVVVVLFAVCWLPYHGYFVYQFINRKVMSSKYVQHIFLAFYWMAMSNAMINPIVYYWMNARYTKCPFISELINQKIIQSNY